MKYFIVQLDNSEKAFLISYIQNDLDSIKSVIDKFKNHHCLNYVSFTETTHDELSKNDDFRHSRLIMSIVNSDYQADKISIFK